MIAYKINHEKEIRISIFHLFSEPPALFASTCMPILIFVS